MARVSQGTNADRGKQPQLPAPSSRTPQEPRLLPPQLTGSARLKTLKNSAMTFTMSCSLQMSMPLEELCLNLIMRQTKSSTISVT